MRGDSHRSTRRGARARGYTLVEVLVVVVILGIAGAMVVPSFGQTGVLRVQAGVRSVVSDITQAQSDSIAYQRGRGIVFHPGQNRYTVVELKTTAVDEALDGLDTVVFNTNEYGDCLITAASFGTGNGPILAFDELGSPVNPPGGGGGNSVGGYVEITGSGQTYRVNVDAFTGRVTVVQTAP